MSQGRREAVNERPELQPLEPRLLLSVTEIPILFVIVEGGPGSEHDMNAAHDADYFRGLLDGTGGEGAPVTASAINYSDVPGSTAGNFGPDAAFPRGSGDDYALRATAEVVVTTAQAGTWTFGVASDDGSRLRIDGQTVILDDAVHAPVDRLGTAYLSPGTHSLELVYFERGFGASVELFAGPGSHTSFDAGFKLVGDPGGLDTSAAGFQVVQRFCRETVDTLAVADRLLAQPYFNVVDYFRENSCGQLKFVPATAGERDGTPDGVVGLYEFPSFERDANVKRRLTLELADPDFDFSVYDTDHNGRLDNSELIVVSIGSDQDGNEYWRTLAKPGTSDLLTEDDFEPGTLWRETRYDQTSQRYYDVIKGKLVGQSVYTEYQYRYYAHPNPPAGRSYWTKTDAYSHALSLGGEFKGWGQGGNGRTPDHEVTLDGVTIGTDYWVPGYGDWTNWATLVHEISHPLGDEFRDLYNLEVFGNATGITDYALMGGTLYAERTFHHDPWTKSRVGWVTPTVINASGYYTLHDVETTGEVLRIQRNADEYFLIENRWGGSSYDGDVLDARDVPGLRLGGIPDEGLAIWHVDETRLSAFDSQDFGGIPFLTKEDAVVPGNDAEDLWDDTRAFSAVSNPNSNWNDGTPSNIIVQMISAPGDTVQLWIGFTGTRPDDCEPNDSYEFAFDTGTGDRGLWDLSIGANDTDIFKWTAPATGEVRVDCWFSHDEGDVDLFLHAADAGHTELASSRSEDDNEDITYDVIGGTSYFVRVVGSAGAMNAHYDLNINGPDIAGDRFEPNDTSATPASLGAGPVSQTGLSVHHANNEDWYVWTAAASGDTNVHILFQDALGDLDLEVYRQADMVRLAKSDTTTDNEDVWVTVKAGTRYLIHVYGYNGAINSDYDLGVAGDGATIPADAMEPNGSFEFAARLGTGDRGLSNLNLSFVGDQDYFEWIAPEAGILSVDLAFSHTVGDLNLYVFDFDHSLLASAESLSDNEHADVPVTRGEHYYVRVESPNGICHTGYALSLDGPDIAPDRFEYNDDSGNATPLGVGNRLEEHLTTHSPGENDWYEWIAWTTGTLDVHLLFENAAGNLDLYVYDDYGIIGQCNTTADGEHVLGLAVQAGQTYRIKVDPSGYIMQYDYTLWIDGPGILPDAREPDDHPLLAYWPVQGDVDIPGQTIHTSGDVDYFWWTSPSTGQLAVDLLFSHAHGDLDIRMWDFDGQWSGAATSATDNEHLVADVLGGHRYVLEVAGYNGAMNDNYRLVIDAPDPQVDLAGTFCDVVPAARAPGDTVPVDWRVANLGPDLAEGADGFWVDFYLSPDGAIDESDYRLGYRWVDPLAGDSDTGIRTDTFATPEAGDPFWSAQGSGTYTIGMMVDHDPAVVTETNEGNNANRGTGLDLDTVQVLTGPLDYGDAPDPTYPTLQAHDGARHVVGSLLYLGARVDAEADGQPNADATGDDAAGRDDDEDGVQFLTPLYVGQQATVRVTASAAGKLDAWVDFNGNGSWSDEGEHIFISRQVVEGPNDLTFTVPAGAVADETFLRFRLSSAGGLAPTGLAPDGEVEDYARDILAGPPASINDATVTEGHTGTTTMAFEVSIPQTFPVDINVYWSTADGTARAGEDYVAAGGVATIQAGQTSAPIVVEVIGDHRYEEDETFTVNLLALDNGVLADAEGIGTIGNDEWPGWSMQVGPGWAPTSEDGMQAYLNVWLQSEPAANVTMQVSVSDPTEAMVSTTVLTFTPQDWMWAHQVTVTGLDDPYPDGDVPYDIIFASMVSEDPDYNGMEIGTWPLVNLDNDQPMDLGDAPGPYPTTIDQDGARHVVVPDLYLGQTVDTEPDGQPSLDATGDDATGRDDDEDGVQFLAPLIAGQQATVRVTASAPGKLDAWVDFNGNGSWSDEGEHVFISRPVVEGPNDLTFTVPASAVEGETFLRFRLSSAGGLAPTGLAPDGEVEDYARDILPPLPVVSIDDAVVTEGDIVGGTVVFHVSIPQPYPLDVGVCYAAADGTALAGEDYYPTSGWATIQAGMTSAPVFIGVVGDYRVEPEESFYVNLTGFTNGVAGDTQGVGTVFDDDAASVQIERLGDSTTEGGGQVYFDLSLTSQPEADVTVHVSVNDPTEATVSPTQVTFTPEDWHLPQRVTVTGVDDPYDDGNIHYTVYFSPIVSEDANYDGLAYSDATLRNLDDEQPMDLGDAGGPYPTTIDQDGARHVVVPGLFLGQTVDTETDVALPGYLGLSDDLDGAVDDEDGVVPIGAWIAGETASVEVIASAPGMLDAWIDFDNDGSWAEAGDQVFASVPLVAGANTLTFPVPACAGGWKFARFRFSSAGGLSYDGLAADGEVEDYKFQILPDAHIYGTVFHDRDGNRLWSGPGIEPGLEGWTVFLDTNGDGQRQPDEPATHTDPEGGFHFGPLDAGTYTVAVVPRAHFMLSAPQHQTYVVTLGMADAAAGLEFGVCLQGDANGDGKVGIADLSAVADNYGLLTGAVWEQGDFNFDGKVGIADLSAVADNYGFNMNDAGGATPQAGGADDPGRTSPPPAPATIDQTGAIPPPVAAITPIVPRDAADLLPADLLAPTTPETAWRYPPASPADDPAVPDVDDVLSLAVLEPALPAS